MYRKLFSMILAGLLILALSACAGEKNENQSSAGSQQGEVQSEGYQKVQAVTAVVTEDAVLTDAYVFNYSVNEDGTYKVTNAGQKLDYEVKVKQGDIVRILTQGESASVVEVLGFSLPLNRGTIGNDRISTDPELISQGNMASLKEGTCYYDSKNGNTAGSAEDVSLVVEILERSDGWCRFLDDAGGKGLQGWIPETDLFYDFDTEIPVPDEIQ